MFIIRIFCAFLVFGVFCYSDLSAQIGNPFYFEGERITSVEYEYTLTLTDPVAQRNLELSVQKIFQVFPRSTVRSFLLDAYTKRVSNLAEVKNAYYEVYPSSMGGVTIRLVVETSENAGKKGDKGGVFAGEKDFPVLYQDKRTLLTTKLAAAQMLYSNNNAWYASDQAMLNGNPLAKNPAGKGFTGWTEAMINAGLYGVSSLSDRKNIYVYGGASYILSGSVGRELFTDKSRAYGAFDDAFLGLVGTAQSASGNRITYNFSAGRQQFSVGKSFIVRNTAANGDNRGALQLNPRWAADFLGLASVRLNNLTLQVFQLDPDELDIVDSRTLYRGFNIEAGDKNASLFGFMMLTAPKSSFNYYTPTGQVLGRKGLQLFNLRYYYNKPPGSEAPFFNAEIAYQRNRNYKMRSLAGYAEAGWNFAKQKGSPTLRYRYAYFSGDDPATAAFERWDPILSGGNGEEWVIGANHFKVVQNSNINVHQVQASFLPWKKIQVVPQAMYMYAASKNNIGGNPALGSLPSREYGTEFNITLKYFRSRHWYWHGHVAYTIPGKGVREAIGNGTRNWLSAMVFLRYSL